jgi:hypothetical protein
VTFAYIGTYITVGLDASPSITLTSIMQCQIFTSRSLHCLIPPLVVVTIRLVYSLVISSQRGMPPAAKPDLFKLPHPSWVGLTRMANVVAGKCQAFSTEWKKDRELVKKAVPAPLPSPTTLPSSYLILRSSTHQRNKNRNTIPSNFFFSFASSGTD